MNTSGLRVPPDRCALGLPRNDGRGAASVTGTALRHTSWCARNDVLGFALPSNQ